MQRFPSNTLPVLVVHVEVEAEIRNSKIDEAQLQRLKNGERPGALWHVFRSDDVEKLRAYISRVCFTSVWSRPMQQSIG